MSAKIQVTKLVQEFQQRRPVRAASMIITIYGDVIHPRADNVWLGSLMTLVAPMGINERLVRTSAYRLVQESWLQADKVGRRSYYRITDAGLRRFRQAFEQVYKMEDDDWSGNWCLALLSQLQPDLRLKVREELKWLGFGNLSPTVMEHPRFTPEQLNPMLQEWGAADDVIVMQAQPVQTHHVKALRNQVRESWNLDALGLRYKRFLETFRPLWQGLKKHDDLSREECLLARLLLIHEYRKILLRDPLLPDELLPNDWEGRSAKRLCRDLYLALYIRADQFLDHHLENASGSLPGPGEGFYRRFGGLTTEGSVLNPTRNLNGTSQSA